MKRIMRILTICALFVFAVYVSILNFQPKKNEIVSSTTMDFPISDSVEKLTKESDIVVIGYFNKLIENWNMARDPKETSKEDLNNYVKGSLYEFEVDDYLKSPGKEQQSIKVNITVSANRVTDERYIEPVIGEKMILFLKKSPIADRYFGTMEPFRFTIDSNIGMVKTNTKVKVVKDNFENKKEFKLEEFKDKVKRSK